MNFSGNDKELTSRLIKSDRKAFDAIYLKYASQLYTYTRKNIPSDEDCEEIIQDIFLLLWEKREKLSHITALNAYLFAMAKHRVIRYFQHEKVKQRYVEHFAKFEAAYEPAPDDTASLRPLIAESLSALPERCRMAVNLRLEENLSNDEIAIRMNIRKTTVENYMVTAVKHFRSTLPNLLKTN